MDAHSYKRLIDLLFEGVYFVDRDRKVTYWSKGAERITGYAEHEVVGRLCRDGILVHLNEQGEAVCDRSCPLEHTIQDGGERAGEFFLLHKDGHRIPVTIRVTPIADPDGRVVGAAEVFSDNQTEEGTARLIEELRSMALLDPLTELGNRRYATMHLDARFKELDRYGWTFGVLFADIDRFKDVNDVYGHDVGDKVLRTVARTLKYGVRAFDSVARWGGEEFLAILVNVGEEHLLPIADKLRCLVEESVLSEGEAAIRVTISIGATLATPHDTPETLVKRADHLMFRSKAAGRNRITIGRDA